MFYIEKGGNNALTGYSDSDLAGNLDDQKSAGGMVFYLNDSLLTRVSETKECGSVFVWSRVYDGHCNSLLRDLAEKSDKSTNRWKDWTCGYMLG